MDPIRMIETRRSVSNLVEPAPGPEALARAFQAAVSAPDHKRLRPWRFLVIEGEARARFGQLVADALKQREPGAPVEVLQKESQKPLRAPLIIVVAATIQPDVPGAPPVEQTLAAGAATQNLLLALHAQGYGTAWKTGPAAYCPVVKAGLGLKPDDQIIGFVYTGSIGAPPAAAPPLAHRDFVTRWTPAR
ncbi:MAG: nitroreductase [Alphaproteobacteria bacterium]|nr:nitroreductase [Alphaproteobacteria bacterium]